MPPTHYLEAYEASDGWYRWKIYHQDPNNRDGEILVSRSDTTFPTKEEALDAGGMFAEQFENKGIVVETIF